jgi:hypothetical protein
MIARLILYIVALFVFIWIVEHWQIIVIIVLTLLGLFAAFVFAGLIATWLRKIPIEEVDGRRWDYRPPIRRRRRR